MGGSADRKQRHHRAVVRQAVEGAGADHRDPVEQRRIDALRGREREVSGPERVERDRETA